MDDRDIREILAQELAGTAAWRRESARDDPHQGANAASASAIDRLIEHIRRLPSDDPRLRELADLNRDGDFFLLGGEGTRELLDQYGTALTEGDDPESAVGLFLARLISAARADEADAEARSNEGR